MRAFPHAVERFCGDDNLLASLTQSLSQYFFGSAGRVDISGIEKIDAVVDAKINLSRGIRPACRSGCAEAAGSVGKGHTPETENRYFKSAFTKEPVFHIMHSALGCSTLPISSFFCYQDRAYEKDAGNADVFLNYTRYRSGGKTTG